MIDQDGELRILVVDDSVISRKLAELAFFGRPYKVSFASDGRQALDLVATRRPDIVITDWMMPDMSGIELCKAIRSQLLRDTYIVMLSSNSTEQHKAEGMAAGADSYLTKPLQTHELLGEIHKARGLMEARRRTPTKLPSGTPKA